MSAVNKSPMVKTAVPINKLYTIHDTLIIGSALYMPLEFLPSFEVIKFVYCQERKKDPIKSAPKTYVGELAIKSHWNNCKNKAKINDNKKKVAYCICGFAFAYSQSFPSVSFRVLCTVMEDIKCQIAITA